MKKIVGALVLLCALSFAFAADAGDLSSAKAKSKKYNKFYLPDGWKFEAGYTVWRSQKGLAANPRTYWKYRQDKAWRKKMHVNDRTEEIILDSVDWTVEELAEFWENYQDYFKFHPAGTTDD